MKRASIGFIRTAVLAGCALFWAFVIHEATR
ncbi:hypothetical protein ABH897_003454 [Paenibacillus sp. RC73]